VNTAEETAANTAILVNVCSMCSIMFIIMVFGLCVVECTVIFVRG